jgi:hypothetical protein
MKIKITLRFHLTPVKMATTNAGKYVPKQEPLNTAGGNSS